MCQITFDERVVGATTDTCNTVGDELEPGFRVNYRYDDRQRQIDGMTFTTSVSRVDVEVLASDDQPPLAEVHHDVVQSYLRPTGQSCGYTCVQPEGLAVPVSFAGLPEGPVDAGPDADAAPSSLDAAVIDAAPNLIDPGAF